MKLYIWSGFIASFHRFKHSGITLATSKAEAIANIMRDIKIDRVITNDVKVKYDAIETYMNANEPASYTLVGADYILDL